MKKNHKSRLYWAKRERANKRKVIKMGERSINELKRILLLNKKDVEQKIADFYKKYGETYAEQLTLSEMKSYKQELKAAVQKYNHDKTLRKLAKKNIPTYKISRLEALQTDLQIQLSYITEQQAAKVDITLKDVAKFSNKMMLNQFKKAYGITFDAINTRKLNKLVNMTWVGRNNWSGKIWKDRDIVGRKLTEILEKGVTQGTSLQKMTTELKSIVDNSYNNCFRIVRTETAHIDSAVKQDIYNQALEEGIATQYQYDAFLDDRTSEICKELNGEIINIEDMVIGENAPPMHPNCRSTTFLI